MIELALTKQRPEFTLTVTTDLAPGLTHGIVGPSGSGKTTLLRLIAGFERVDGGHLSVAGQVWDDGGAVFVPPQQRRCGMVGQDYALFPHLNVWQNMTFAAPKDSPLLAELTALLKLETLLKKRSGALSGGQKQRVALARALAFQPDVLILDEALSAQDEALREDIQQWLKNYQRQHQLTVLLVSHNRDEVALLADTVLTLNHGQVVVPMNA
ncbi:MAG: ATP-binding cassette domain-containing protein [Neisseriaceae bacterium]|nr:ATP-binding cassette domain-containing protein [Neisseriaceae bacterium]MBP6862288.1 ATP-binding cassette domain-containing protein [Neisseriaceae bacterium]